MSDLKHTSAFARALSLSCSATDWFFFEILDLSNPAITSIPTGVRVIIGLLQATAVRAAGFGTVSLSALAPAVKYDIHSYTNIMTQIPPRVLYVIMMYVSVCEYNDLHEYAKIMTFRQTQSP